jgi:CheY-like chemotaxis protein
MSASNGYDALTLLKEQSVDVLFADLIMPGMSGWELAHQVQRHHRRIRLILTSGVVPLDSDLPGDMQFLKKPYQFVDLISALRKAK